MRSLSKKRQGFRPQEQTNWRPTDTDLLAVRLRNCHFSAMYGYLAIPPTQSLSKPSWKPHMAQIVPGVTLACFACGNRRVDWSNRPPGEREHSVEWTDTMGLLIGRQTTSSWKEGLMSLFTVSCSLVLVHVLMSARLNQCWSSLGPLEGIQIIQWSFGMKDVDRERKYIIICQVYLICGCSAGTQS